MVVQTQSCKVVDLGPIQVHDLKLGDVSLNVFPIYKEYLKDIEFIKELPEIFYSNLGVITNIFSKVPYVQGTSNLHYVTISSKFFTERSTLRREGLHIDGNFCADLSFQHKTWGGTTWGGTSVEGFKVVSQFVNPYGLLAPFGKYVSSELGGIFCCSSLAGCEAWQGDYPDDVGDQGDVEHLRDYMGGMAKVSLEANRLYFMTSNTPHESLPIEAGKRRTLIRVTLAHDYPNKHLVLT